jgi:TrmH family RNA methyltransferase
MSPDRITSRANPLIKDLARLHKRRERRTTSRFLIEGAREVRRALQGGVQIERFLVSPELVDARRLAFVADLRRSADVVEVGESAFGALSRRQAPDGILAVGRSVHRNPDALHLPDNALVLVPEGIEKPGNLGAMFRTADGAGVDAVLVADAIVDLENPNVIRASQGSVFTVPSAVAGSTAAIDLLGERGVTVVAVSPDADADLWDIDLTGSVALAIGSEDSGLSKQMRGVGRSARLPMLGRADSLNASAAAAVALYEAVRQRSSGQRG